ncbi:hypothetical protein ABIC47_002058 [Leifsonia sp. 563]|uniref:hypothetical protein n=1 Tax=Leifsonia sp. 563 TaxID=3156412 RepID=UPI003397BAAA
MSGAEFAHPGARVALAAIDRNLASLQEARLGGLETDPHRAEELMPWIGQALFWIVAVDDLLVRAHKGRSYREKRDADADGRYLDGARLARNAVAHGVVILHRFQQGMTFPMTFPMTFGEVRWSSLDDVLAEWSPDMPLPEGQRDSYRRFFYNIQPQEPLRAAQRWLLAAPPRGWTL